MILVYLIALSVVVGYLRGGRLKHYLDRPLSSVFLPVVAFALEAAIPLAGAKLLAPVVILEYALLFAFIFVNRKVPAVRLIAVGVLLNALVIFANGFRMPVTPVAFDPAFEHFVKSVQSGELIEYVLVGWDGPLWFLGDTIPINHVVPGIASIGDLVLAVGMCWLIQSFMVSRAKDAAQTQQRA